MNEQFNLIQAIRNPQQYLESALQSNPQLQNNQPLMNAFTAMKKGDNRQAELIARNVCEQQGVNIEQMINNLKNLIRQ